MYKENDLGESRRNNHGREREPWEELLWIMEDMKILSVNPRVCGWVYFSHTPVRRNRKTRNVEKHILRGGEGQRERESGQLKRLKSGFCRHVCFQTQEFSLNLNIQGSQKRKISIICFSFVFHYSCPVSILEDAI